MGKAKTMQELFDEMSLFVEDGRKDDKLYGAMCITFDDGKVSCKVVGNGNGISAAIADMMLTDDELANVIRTAYLWYAQCASKRVEPFYDAIAKHIEDIQANLLGGDPKESPTCICSAKFQNRKN